MSKNASDTYENIEGILISHVIHLWRLGTFYDIRIRGSLAPSIYIVFQQILLQPNEFQILAYSSNCIEEI